MDLKTLQRNIFAMFSLCGINFAKMAALNYTRLIFINSVYLIWCSCTVLDMYLHWESVDSLGKGLVIPMSVRNVYNMVLFVKDFEEWKSTLQQVKGFSINGEQNESLQKPIIVVMKFIKIYLYAVAMAVLALNTTSLFNGILLFYLYPLCNLKKSDCFYFLLILNLVYEFFIVLNIVMSELLFVYLILSLYCEMDVLKCDIKALDLDNSPTVQIRNTIQKHSKLIGVSSRIRRLYSNALLFQYSGSTLSVTVLLYIMCSEGIPPTFDRIMQNFIPIIALLVQMAVYCIGGTIIKYQGLSVSDVIFEKNWWMRTEPDTRRALALMILAAQQPTILSIGEVMQVGLDNLMKVIRTAASIFTLMRNVQQE